MKLSSADAFNMDRSKILSFGKGLTPGLHPADDYTEVCVAETTDKVAESAEQYQTARMCRLICFTISAKIQVWSGNTR